MSLMELRELVNELGGKLAQIALHGQQLPFDDDWQDKQWHFGRDMLNIIDAIEFMVIDMQMLR